MIYSIKKRINKLIFPNTHNSQAFVKFLRRKGCSIGEGTYFFSPRSTTIDVTRPILLTIGDYCKITGGVTILTHDYSRSVLRRSYGEIIAEAGETIIGNNVFIGMNATIMMGVTVGNNVIIGAGSLVIKDVPDNVVVGGNPAKILCTIEEFYNKRKLKYIDEAKMYAIKTYKTTGKKPTIESMGPFFPLYLERNNFNVQKYSSFFNLSGDNREEVIEEFLKSKPIYKNFEEFLEDVKFD